METKILRFILGIFFIIFAFIIVTSSFYTVESGEQVIIERLGEKVKLVKDAGIKFKIPIIDRIIKVQTEALRTIQYGYIATEKPTTKKTATYEDVAEEAIILTKGSYLINVEAMIQYKILDAADYIYNVDDQLGTIRLAFESVLRRNVQNKDLDDALLNKERISSEVLPELVKKTKSYGLGIEIKSLKIQNITVPSNVKAAYDDVNNAINEKTELLDKANRYKNEKLPGARAKAYKLIQDAEAYKAEKVSQAKGDVENFVQVYEKYKVAKDITKTRLYLETMEKILTKVKNKYIIDSSNDNVIKYLPINPKSITPVKEAQ
ncbi:FtsH protease activity modulator HflK [Paramaledivibacter caminithermalis]|jgi:membrane protease subunit HflK|uniref:Protein HflK n=1 Tax=Paramaledivibacter caminithermalis (strain DSM 15212 / CIP 107654 / DViRD3) TaxID=1121301 RepID=A0A1M6NNQ3_PARC5|nr:FtsH protease activity modulator HflK [Paramaledivibacter caminithermalis]SHJ97313.1 membrane protease subunit HflK [Paramaledivibacter caminithermalis DSM 15212]